MWTPTSVAARSLAIRPCRGGLGYRNSGSVSRFRDVERVAETRCGISIRIGTPRRVITPTPQEGCALASPQYANITQDGFPASDMSRLAWTFLLEQADSPPKGVTMSIQPSLRRTAWPSRPRACQGLRLYGRSSDTCQLVVPLLTTRVLKGLLTHGVDASHRAGRGRTGYSGTSREQVPTARRIKCEV